MNMKQLYSVVNSPVISEKSTYYAENQKRFVFKVKKTANKQVIKSAIELMFKVEDDSVHVLNVKGKTKRFGRFIGTRSDWKKAYIKLKPGFDIDLSPA